MYNTRTRNTRDLNETKTIREIEDRERVQALQHR